MNAHPPVGHLGGCAPCSDPQRADCPAGQTLTDQLRAARAAQTETARWN